MRALDGLDSVDWGALTHAYGDAADVPGALRELTSNDAKQRADAINKLFDNIWHQGTVYVATAPAVPFLFRLLADPTTIDRSEIAVLLASVAIGQGYYIVHAWGEEATYRRILADSGRTLEEVLNCEHIAVENVRRAVSEHLLDLLPFLNDEHAEVRLRIAECLGAYPQHSAVLIPAMQAAGSTEKCDEVLAAIAQSLDRLCKSQL